MSQVATKRKLRISNERVNVTAYFHEQGSVLRGDAEGFCDRFEISIDLDTEEPEEIIFELINLARRMCFTEKALVDQVPVGFRQIINGKVVEI